MECTCTLNGNQMMEQLEAWREMATHAVSRRIEAGQITSLYPADPGVITRLKELIASEAECCSFLRFTVEEGSAETVVKLSFPEDASELVENIIPELADK